MYNEPDWSSLTLTELLEKAQAFGKKAYSNSRSTFAFLERALEASPPQYSTATIEIAELEEKAQKAFQLLAEVNHGLARFVPENKNEQEE